MGRFTPWEMGGEFEDIGAARRWPPRSATARAVNRMTKFPICFCTLGARGSQSARSTRTRTHSPKDRTTLANLASRVQMARWMIFSGHDRYARHNRFAPAAVRFEWLAL